MVNQTRLCLFSGCELDADRRIEQFGPAGELRLYFCEEHEFLFRDFLEGRLQASEIDLDMSRAELIPADPPSGEEPR